MSNYFRDFPRTLYLFGDEDDAVSFQKLSKYSGIIDRVRNDISTYIELEIRDGDRPDVLSNRLYDTPKYDWTFFLMNERLRETGWPLSHRDVYSRATTDYYPNYTAKLDITTGDSASEFADIYPVGQAVLVSGSDGVVVSRDLSVGEITISSDSDLTTKTLLQYDDGSNTTALSNTVYQYEGTHHYEDEDGEWVDRYFGSEPNKLPVTNLEHLVAQNDASRRIAVIKERYITQVVGEYKRAIEQE